jgi:hypothetical protein
MRFHLVAFENLEEIKPHGNEWKYSFSG